MTSETLPVLWHHTCEHAQREIGAEGNLMSVFDLEGKRAKALTVNSQMMRLWLSFIWLTDLAVPDREGLGLTMHAIGCDRTRHRYRVTDPSTCEPWGHYRMRLSPGMRDLLELADGAMPARWWVSTDPVPVVYDPLP
jgi:hypothetical protein